MVYELFSKSEVFFLYPKLISETVLRGVRLLKDMMEEPSHIEENVRMIKEVEEVADQIVYEAVTVLRRSLVTSTGCDSSYNLITQMDGVLDYVDEISERFVLYGINDVTTEAIVLIEILEKSVEELAKCMVALRGLKSPQKVFDTCYEVKRLKVKAERILRRATAGFLTNMGDEIEIFFKWKDIYIGLERAIDRCEDVASILEKAVSGWT